LTTVDQEIAVVCTTPVSTLRVVPRAIPTMAPCPGEVIAYTGLPESPWSAGNPSISNQPLLTVVTVPQDSPW